MLTYVGLICLLFSLFVIPDVKCSKLQRRSDSKIEEANEYLDNVIENTLEENRDKLEPYRPGNMNFSFEHKVLFVTFTREIALEDLVITGLTTVHREGDCKRSNQGGISKLSANLGMGVLEFESKAKAKFMKIGPTFQLSGTIAYAMIHLEVTRDNNAGTPPSIKKLEIYEHKGTEIKVSGLGPLNKFSELIVKAAMKLFSGKMNKKMEEKLKESMNEKFERSIFPLD